MRHFDACFFEARSLPFATDRLVLQGDLSEPVLGLCLDLLSNFLFTLYPFLFAAAYWNVGIRL